MSPNFLEQEDYISLTDMLKAKDGDFFISDWLRNRNTVEFLGIWERVHNPAFNYGEFATIRSMSGLNSYKISVKEWVEKTNAIGIKATAGRYGGTYAHRDIAFEFGMWISAGKFINLFRRRTLFDRGMLLCYTNTHSFHERTHHMQPAIILDLQIEFLTEPPVSL